MKMIVFLKEVTPRIDYIFNLIVGKIAGIDFAFTTSESEYASFDGPKLSYGVKTSADGLFQANIDLLFRDTIEPVETTITHYRDTPVFFSVNDSDSLFPFDLFAASFYLVVRYEEYLHFKGDKYGRFTPEESIASRGKFLQIPVVNIWALMLREKIRSRYPSIIIKKGEFRHIATIDIDHAYAYRMRSAKRIIGGYGRSLMNMRFWEIFERTLVLSRLKKDPYDNYDLIIDLHQRNRLIPVFFVLYAQYGGQDNNVSLRRKGFKKLLKKLSMSGEVGVHPSLASKHKFSRLKREIFGLSHALQADVTKSRQHFLRFTLPETYRNLIEAGIREDFTMGYASEPGFRAGIAVPFPFFDLKSNTTTRLIVHPVMVMDVTLKDYLRLNTVDALSRTKKIIDETVRAEGEFISLWHNESFSESGHWKGWTEVYKNILEYCREITIENDLPSSQRKNRQE